MENHIIPDEENPRGNSSLKGWIGLTLLGLIFIEFFSPILFQDRMIFFRDFSLITYPVKFFLHQSYHAGALPHWIQSIDNGTPFMATLHPGVFYPPSWILFLEDFSTGLNLFYIFHFLLLTMSVFALTRYWGMSTTASLCSSLTAFLSGFTLSATLLSNLFLSAVWFPAILLFFEKFLREEKKRHFLLAVIFLACQVLAACPEINLMTVLLMLFYGVFYLPEKRTLKTTGRAVAALAGVVILALGLTAIQLWPTLNLVKESMRSGGLSYEAHVAWSLDWEKLAGLVLPVNFNQFIVVNKGGNWGFLQSIYMGLIPVLFLVLGCWYFKRKPFRFWILFFLGGLFFALGANNPLYEWIFPWVPFLDRFRYPEKYFFYCAFSLVFLVGFGLDALIESTRQKQIKIKPVLAVIFLMFAGVGAVGIGWPDRDPTHSFLLLFFLGLCYLMFYFGKVDGLKFKGLVLIVLYLDLLGSNSALIPLIHKNFYEEKPLMVHKILRDRENEITRTYSGKIRKKPSKLKHAAAPNRLAGQWVAKEHLHPYLGLVYGIEYPDGLSGLAMMLTDPWIWTQILQRSDPERRFLVLKRTNVKFWADVDMPSRFADNTPLILPGRLKVFDDYLPRAFLVPRAVQGVSPILLNKYFDKKFDPLAEVLLSEHVDHQASPNFKGKVESLEYGPNRVTVKTSQRGQGFLVLMDSYFPGWTVKVDGREQKIFRANHFFRTVHLDSGRHTLEFEYETVGYRAGLYITGLTAMIMVVGILAVRWRKRPLPAENSSIQPE